MLRRRNRSIRRVTLENLESRRLFSTVVALTAGQQLVTFDSATPGTVLTSVAVTGLTQGETLASLDYRPGTGQLFALSSQNRVFTINLSSGALTQVGTTALPFVFAGERRSIDFNPNVDRIRITSSTGENVRAIPATGAQVGTGDTALTYAVGDPNAAATPTVAAVAYDRNTSSTPLTTMYAIDSALDTLITVGSVDGTVSPNTGVSNTVGALGFNTTGNVGFDIAEGDAAAFASLSLDGAAASGLYSIDLTTGAATLVGTIGVGSLVTDIAILPVERTFFALAASRTSLVSFSLTNLAAPSAPVAITGLQAGETITGLDFRPATGELFALGSSQRLYTINPATGAATQVGTDAFAVNLTGTAFGLDFNPTVDRLRVVSDTETNGRINPATGALVDSNTTLDGVQLDAPVAYTDAGDAPDIIAAAYTANRAGATATTMYVIDANRNTLTRQGSLAGANPVDSPNNGVLTAVGGLRLQVGNTAVDVNAGSLDIHSAASADVAYLLASVEGTTGTQLYTVNLATGQLVPLGTLGDGTATFAELAVGLSVISLSPLTVSESSTTATVTVTRGGLTSASATVPVSVTGGTATAGVDYGQAGVATFSTSVVFAPGETSRTFLVPLLGDAIDEANETVALTLAPATDGGQSGTQYGLSTANLTLTDDDATPSVSISNVTVAEPNGTNVASATFNITLSAPSGQTVTVQVATDGSGNATAGSDYTALDATTVTFLPGETAKTVSVAVLADTVNESNETFGAVLTSPTNATLAADAGVATITGNLTLAVSDVSVTEPTGTNTAFATFTVTLSAASATAVTVQVATNASGTALSGTDYTALPLTTLTFNPNETTKTFTVTVRGDNAAELAETFGVVLSNPTGATLADAEGTGTINSRVADRTLEPVARGSRNSDLFNLSVIGTAGDDNILVTRFKTGPARGRLDVKLNGVSIEPAGFDAKTYRVIVFALGGDDIVRVDAALSIPALLAGGDGNDLLIGSSRRDILIGGTGVDALFGRGGDDILIGGDTTHATNLVALASLHQRLIGSGSFTTRRTALTSGTGVSGGFALSATTVLNDNAADYLTGDTGSDLFFTSAKDIASDDRINGAVVNL
jgi:hypothetical protein